MEKEFIPYEQALALKELGFDEPCFGFHYVNPLNNSYTELKYGMSIFKITSTEILKGHILAPTFSQAFRWFREKYNLNSFIIDSKSYNWYFNINNMIKDDVVSEVLYFKTYEEAELECLKKLIEIVKEK